METLTEKSTKEIAPRWKETYAKAKESLNSGNYKYVVDILHRILQAEPGYAEARSLLYQAKLAHAQNKSKIIRAILGTPIAYVLYYLWAPLLMRKERYPAVVKIAERLMSVDALNPLILLVLSRALQRAGAMQSALAVTEMASRCHTRHFKIWKELSDLYGKTGFKEKQLETLETLNAIRPDDGQIQTRLTQTRALVAMNQGKWEQASSYRDVIRDEEKAQTLEQQERRAPRDEDSLQSLIADAEQKLAETGSVANHTRLADLYRRRQDYERAVEQYREALNKSQGYDPTLQKTINETQCESYDAAIQRWRQHAENTPGEKEEAAEKIKSLEAEKQQLVREHLEEMVKRYPNEPQYHYDLGEFYYHQDEIDAALKQFQQASKSPRIRRNALVHTGLCMIRKNMYDLAIDQFETVLGELSDRMDKNRKEVLYNLAWTHEQKGDREKARDYYKEIYKVDAGYKDVSEKLEAFYPESS